MWFACFISFWCLRVWSSICDCVFELQWYCYCATYFLRFRWSCSCIFICGASSYVCFVLCVLGGFFFFFISSLYVLASSLNIFILGSVSFMSHGDWGFPVCSPYIHTYITTCTYSNTGAVRNVPHASWWVSNSTAGVLCSVCVYRRHWRSGCMWCCCCCLRRRRCYCSSVGLFETDCFTFINFQFFWPCNNFSIFFTQHRSILTNIHTLI